MLTLNDEDRREVWKVYVARGKVEALALARRRTGAGLREAADAVDSLVREHESPIPPSDLLDRAVRCLITGGDSGRLTGAVMDLDGGAGRWTRAEQDEALRRARLLYDRACELCAQHRGHKSILMELRSSCPGFSDEAYEKMHWHGMFVMR